jgi:hypothetical protein
MEYSTNEAAHLTGLTYRMLNRWDTLSPTLRASYAPNGSGSRRYYTAGDIERLRKAADFVHAFGPLGDLPIATVAAFVESALQVAGTWHWKASDDAIIIVSRSTPLLLERAS